MSHRLAAPAAYVLMIVAANVVTAHIGLISMGFGLLAPAGVVFAGLALLLRDLLPGRRTVLALIALGAAVSAVLSEPALAVASAAAFLVSELVDWAAFATARRRGWSWVRAAMGSNLVSAPLDTVIFLWLSGFGLAAPIVAGQLVGKLLYATILPAVAVAAFVRLRRSRPATA